MQHFGSPATDVARTVPGRPVGQSMLRGLLCRCPACGEGRLFRSYLKSVDACAVCGEEMHHHRADDFPAYISVFIVGHIVVAAFMATDTWLTLKDWQHLAIWVPMSILMSILILPRVKGAVIGMQWALAMHGFGGEDDEARLDKLPEEEPA